MATIWKTRGAPTSSDWNHGTPMPLAAIAERLGKYQLHYLGAESKPIEPTTAYAEHIVIEVSRVDTPFDRFDKPGYYHVLGLLARDAGFLFVPTPPFR